MPKHPKETVTGRVLHDPVKDKLRPIYPLDLSKIKTIDDLVRAVEATLGSHLLHGRRKVSNSEHLTNGPAKLCEAMEIDRSLDGADLCSVRSPLFIARNKSLAKFKRERGPVVTTTRVGITRAADLPLRFYLDRSPFVSKRRAARAR